MMSLRTLALFQVDQLVDNVFFDEHHDAPSCLFLNAVEFVISPASNHDWGLFGLCFTGCNKSFLEVFIFNEEQDNFFLKG